MDDKLVIKLTAKIYELEQKLGEAERATRRTQRKIESGFSRSMKDMQKMAAGFVAVAAGLREVGDWIEAYITQEEAENVVANMVKATGEAAGFTAGELNKMASEMQKVAGYGDEEILKDVTAGLLAYDKVSGEVFERAQMLVLDMSAATGEGMREISKRVGRALQAPTEAFSLLKRSGIVFSESQEQVIRTMVETGDVAGAQGEIVKALANIFGGSAAAKLQGFAGEVKMLQLRLGDLSESAGEALVPTLIDVIDLGERVTTLFEDMAGGASELGEALRTVVVDMNPLIDAARYSAWAIEQASNLLGGGGEDGEPSWIERAGKDVIDARRSIFGKGWLFGGGDEADAGSILNRNPEAGGTPIVPGDAGDGDAGDALADQVKAIEQYYKDLGVLAEGYYEYQLSKINERASEMQAAAGDEVNVERWKAGEIKKLEDSIDKARSDPEAAKRIEEHNRMRLQIVEQYYTALGMFADGWYDYRVAQIDAETEKMRQAAGDVIDVERWKHEQLAALQAEIDQALNAPVSESFGNDLAGMDEQLSAADEQFSEFEANRMAEVDQRIDAEQEAAAEMRKAFDDGISGAALLGQTLDNAFSQSGKSLLSYMSQALRVALNIHQALNSNKSGFGQILGFASAAVPGLGILGSIFGFAGGGVVDRTGGGVKITPASSLPPGYLVPGGYPNDSYLIGVQSGERVTVSPSGTPAASRGGQALGMDAVLRALQEVNESIQAQTMNQVARPMRVIVENATNAAQTVEGVVQPAMNRLERAGRNLKEVR